MAKFKFVGQPESGEDKMGRGYVSVTAFGIEFPLGAWVTVDDAGAIAKLRGNTHFVEQLATSDSGKSSDATD